MEPRADRPKTARDEAIEAAQARKPPDTAAADRRKVVDAALRLTGDLAGERDDAAENVSPDAGSAPLVGPVEDFSRPVALPGMPPVGADEVVGFEPTAGPQAPPFSDAAIDLFRAPREDERGELELPLVDVGLPHESVAPVPQYVERPRPSLHPLTWQFDPQTAAATAAQVQAAARNPAIQQLVAQSPEIETLPLLDADGRPTVDLQSATRSLVPWEPAATQAIGDPRFTPRPTAKPRDQLTRIDRAPLFSPAWIDQQTRQPVLYDGEDPYEALDTHPWQRPAQPARPWSLPQWTATEPEDTDDPIVPQFAAEPTTVAMSPPASESGQTSDAAPTDGNRESLGTTWPTINVQYAEPEKLFEAELDALADRLRTEARQEADHSVHDYHWWQQCEERAQWGS